MTSEQIWLKLKDVEKLGIHTRTLNRKCVNGTFVCRKVPSPGKKGFTYEILLDSLPQDCKKMYVSQLAAKPEETTVKSYLVKTDADVSDPETEALLISSMKEWERQYVKNFLFVYEVTKTIKTKSQLEFFLDNYAQKNPECTWSSYKSFMRLKKIYEDSGFTVNAIRPKWGKRESTVNDEWSTLFENEYLNQRQPSSYSCWKNVLGAIKREDPTFDISQFPSHMSFMRKLKSKFSESSIFYMRNGLAKWKAKYGYHISRHYDDILCGEVWVSDHVQSDVSVETADGRTHFMWITVWIDVKSQKWLGWDVHIEAPKSDHIFTAFYRAAKRYGIPSDVIIDNGKDYRSKALSGGRVINTWHKMQVDEKLSISLFTDLKITVHFAWPYNPESKICERTFSKVNAGFSRHNIGYRGPNITKRPDNLKDDINAGKVWKIHEFEEVFDRYITEVYNREQSTGKVLRGKCPDELFNIEWPQAIQEQRCYQISPEALKMFCSPLSVPIKIRKSVVEDSKLEIRYYAPWMVSANGKVVRMRRDPKDYSVAWFWEDNTGSYLGTAELDGNVSAMARTPVQREQLEEAIRRKRFVERSVKKIAKTVAGTNNADYIENRIAGVKALNDARGFTDADPKTTEIYMATSMDKIITEHKRKVANNYDYSLEADMSEKKDPLDDLDLYGVKAAGF
jgi:hypothetical protein